MNEARFKGLQRHYMSQHPDVPKYVANQFYLNKIIPSFKQSIQKPSGSHQSDPNAETIAPSGHTLPSEILHGNEDIEGITWNQKPTQIEIHPLKFDNQTSNIFLHWKFGYAPQDKYVRNDSARFDVQRNMMQKNTGKNEPVVVLNTGSRLKLMEGFHRTMLFLLSGAPQDQIEILKNGQDLNGLNFHSWKPVKIWAYVGEKRTQ